MNFQVVIAVILEAFFIANQEYKEKEAQHLALAARHWTDLEEQKIQGADFDYVAWALEPLLSELCDR